MDEERARVDREREAKQQRERAEAAERESRVRLRIQDEALAAARERERRALEERRWAEEQARLDGIREAELERVRREAAQKATLESTMAEREHALRLATIRAAASVRATRIGLVAAGVVGLGLVATLLVLELSVHPQRLAALQTEYGALTAGERARADRTEALLRTSDAARRGLEARVHTLEGEAEAVAPVQAPPAAKPPHGAPRVTPGLRGQRPPPCVDDHDPLNPCLSP
jgi:hypothetical protein